MSNRSLVASPSVIASAIMWGVRERNPQGIGGEVGMERTQIALINRSGVIQASHKFKACGVLTP
jgi:hypothetical protein